MEKTRLFIDMDGTLARFQQVDAIEALYQKGYFEDLEPMPNVVNAVKLIVQEHPEKEVYIMSAVLTDSPYALDEKNAWLNYYLPEIDDAHRIFPPCGADKQDYVPGGIKNSDHLLDDYTVNLKAWKPPAKTIKLLNGINNTKSNWMGNMLRYDKRPEELAQNMIDIMDGKVLIQDEHPIEQYVAWANAQYDSSHKTGYISADLKKKLIYVTREQAAAALDKGIHICCVAEYQEYQGIHAEEYLLQELVDNEELSKVYGTQGKGIQHKACISPYYKGAADLKEMIRRECGLNESKYFEQQTVKKQNRTAELRL